MLLFGLFRISELTGDERIEIPPLTMDKITISKGSFTVGLNKYKHSKGNAADIEVIAQSDKSICPVKTLKCYLKLRGLASGPVFLTEAGKPITKAFFSKLLVKCCKSANISPPLSSHCFRIGGANIAAQQGRSEVEIKMLGRWKSSAHNNYLRKVPPLLMSFPSNTPRNDVPGTSQRSGSTTRPRKDTRTEGRRHKKQDALKK